MKKTIIVVLIIGILASIGLGYKFFFSNNDSKFSVVEAKLDNLTEKVSVTGSVVPYQRVKIEPKVNEEVEQVGVQVSDQVQKGDLLIQLDSEDTRIQVRKAQSSVQSVEKEIELLKTQLKNAEKDLEQTKENTAQTIQKAQSSLKEGESNLKDVRDLADKQLEQAYEDGRTTANTSLLTAQTALIELDDIVQDYFTTNDQISLKVRSKQKSAESTIEKAETLIKEGEMAESKTKTKEAILKLEDALKEIKETIRYTRDEAIQSPLYKNDVSSTEKTTLETQKGYVETAISNLITAKQAIESQEISSRKSINTAQFQLNNAQINLESANTQSEQKITQAKSRIEELEDQLELKKSTLTSVQSNLAQARKNLNDTSIRAPISGIVTQVNIEIGESAKLGQVIAEIIPEEKYKIEADVSEVDMAELEKGDQVNVDFDAFQDKKFQGKVTKIYPSEIVKQGVIYYRVEVELNQYPEKVKSGLTANLEIITDKKDQTLVVPYVAVKKDDQGQYVQIIEDNQIKGKRRVEVGLEGETMIEITKGLEEGEKVATYIEE